MTRGRDPERLLRWYPPAWRRRYGAELVTLLEDTYGPGPVPWRCRLALLWAGTAERLRESGLRGSAAPPSDGVRSGSLLVLWAWAVFLVAGAGFANRADNWKAAVPAGAVRVPMAGYGTVLGAGFAGSVIVLLAACACVPSLARFLGAGGWPVIRRRVLQAAALLAVTLAAVAAMKVWSLRLDLAQRNGGSWGYSALFGVVALLATATIGAWAAAITATARRLDLPPAVLRYCCGLAVGLTFVMAALVVGAVTWWTAMASRAPGFLGSAAPAPLVAVGVLMVLGLVLGVIGARRATGSLRRMA